MQTEGADAISTLGLTFGDDVREGRLRLADLVQTRECDTSPRSEALLSHASDIGADLIVMGAYGHGRFREFVLGGATRTILQTMTVPALMSH